MDRCSRCCFIILAAAAFGSCASYASRVDAVTKATRKTAAYGDGRGSGRSVIILASAPGANTENIARTIASVLGARILSPMEASSADLSSADIIGFGSGIMDQAHHPALLSFADGLAARAGGRAFLFSTSGVSRQFALKHGIDDPHAPLRKKLEKKGYAIVGEFNCAGFNANSFLKFFGGMNRDRPNQEDLAHAAAFARELAAPEQSH